MRLVTPVVLVLTLFVLVFGSAPEARCQAGPCDIAAIGFVSFGPGAVIVARNGDYYATGHLSDEVYPSGNFFGAPTPGQEIIGGGTLGDGIVVADSEGNRYGIGVAGCCAVTSAGPNLFDAAGLPRGRIVAFRPTMKTLVAFFITDAGAMYSYDGQTWSLTGVLAGGITPAVQRTWGSLKVMYR